jgi:hypothetical protein
MAIARSSAGHATLRWELRRQLRDLGKYSRAVPTCCGAKAWSDGAVARLRPRRESGQLRRRATRYAALGVLVLAVATCAGVSFGRYVHWLRTTEAVAGEPVKKVDRWTAYCRVKPWSQGCRIATPAVSVWRPLAVSAASDTPPPRIGSSPAKPFENGMPHA